MKTLRSHARLREVPLSAIQPEGWLRRYLETQRDGLTGHLEAAGYPYNTAGWACRRIKAAAGPDWAPYEQYAYWVDGMIRCGHLLRDPWLIRKAARQIDYVLRHADRDGYLGPRHLKARSAVGQEWQWSRWPHAVFFRALMAQHSATGDRRIVRALARHYLSETCDHSDGREVCNVEAGLWAYEKTGDRRLLDHAVRAYRRYNRLSAGRDTTLASMLSGRRATEHGVTYNEIGKLGAILYMYTGHRRCLDATLNAYCKLDRDQMLIDGVCSSSERLRGKDPLDSHETCDIADYTWSVGYLLMATGHPDYADKIERACFNAAPGAVRSDFKGLQYFSCPNQVIAARNSNHNPFFRAHPFMSYRPNPGTECCAGEVHRITPNYVSRMWMTDAAGALTACLYGPCRITARVGAARREVTIVEETDYPFSERIDFQIRAVQPVAFPLQLRIPGWCRRPEVLLNGRPLSVPARPGAFVRIEREFSHNDRVTLVLPMAVNLSRWPRGGIGIERGPLVYALRIAEDWRVDRREPRSTPEFPAWNLYPASAWNYALNVDPGRLKEQVRIVRRAMTPEPWSLVSAPLELRVPARRVRGWTIEKRKVVTEEIWTGAFTQHTVKGNFAFTPRLPDPATLRSRLGRRVETVTLVPYGCTKLRLAVFPNARGG